MKKIISLLLVACMALAFAGCGLRTPSFDKLNDIKDQYLNNDSEKTEESESSEEALNEETNPIASESEGISSYIGKSVKEITDELGTNYEVMEYQGASWMVYSDAPYSFAYGVDASGIDMDSKPEETDVVFCAAGREDVVIIGDIRVGMSISDLEKYLGESLNVEYNEMEDGYFAYFMKDGFEYEIYLDYNDIVITSCGVDRIINFAY